MDYRGLVLVGVLHDASVQCYIVDVSCIRPVVGVVLCVFYVGVARHLQQSAVAGVYEFLYATFCGVVVPIISI